MYVPTNRSKNRRHDSPRIRCQLVIRVPFMYQSIISLKKVETRLIQCIRVRKPSALNPMCLYLLGALCPRWILVDVMQPRCNSEVED